MESQAKAPVAFPPGALLRVEQIVGNPKKGVAGLLPISAATFWRWVQKGHIPAGRKLGPNVTVWPLEQILALGQPEGAGEVA